MGIIKVIKKLFYYSKVKTMIIIFQILLSVYFLTFFLIPFIKNIDTLNLISNINLDNKYLYVEALHIKSSYATDNSHRNYETINKYLNETNNVKNCSGVVQIHTQYENVNTFLYDIPFCYEMKLPLHKGTWFKEIDESNVMPVIISYSLKDKYPLNSTIDLQIESRETNKHIDVKVKVIGILKKNGYLFLGGSNNSNAGISDWFKRSKDEKIMIMPNKFDISKMEYISYPGRIIEIDNTKNLLNVENEINSLGIGKIYSMENLKKNDFYNLYDLNSELIYQFIIILIFIVASIGGYNTLEVLNYKRIMTIFYINGMEWKKGIIIIALKNFLFIVIPAVIFSIICTNSVSKLNGISFDWRVIIITTVIYTLLFLTTTIGIIANLIKINPVVVLKEVD